MSVLVTSSQIQLFPPAYMMNRFRAADKIIILEEAQYTKKQFFDHFRVGEREVNFKIPLGGGASRRPLDSISMVYFDDWVAKVERELPNLYTQSQHFEAGYDWLRELLKDCRGMKSLHALCIFTLMRLFEALDITGTEVVLSKQLIPERPEDPSEWIARLTYRVSGSRYFQGRAAMDDYFDPKPFEQAGIELYCQQWHPPQMMKPHIGMHKSILHSIFMQGFENTAEGLKGNGVVRWPVKGE